LNGAANRSKRRLRQNFRSSPLLIFMSPVSGQWGDERFFLHFPHQSPTGAKLGVRHVPAHGGRPRCGARSNHGSPNMRRATSGFARFPRGPHGYHVLPPMNQTAAMAPFARPFDPRAFGPRWRTEKWCRWSPHPAIDQWNAPGRACPSPSGIAMGGPDRTQFRRGLSQASSALRSGIPNFQRRAGRRAGQVPHSGSKPFFKGSDTPSPFYPKTHFQAWPYQMPDPPHRFLNWLSTRCYRIGSLCHRSLSGWDATVRMLAENVSSELIYRGSQC